jgi:predicted anti-sigma-YlaC factor YlaD
MRCEQNEWWMMEALEGGLATRDRRQLVAHLETCADCRVEWDALNALERLLARPPMASPAPGFASRVEARLVRYEAQRRTLVGGLILLGAAAALCLLAIPSLLNGRNVLEAYGAFLGGAYDLLSYGVLLSYKLVSVLWLILDALAQSVDIPLVNLLTYAVGAVLAAVAMRRAMVSQRLPVQREENGH